MKDYPKSISKQFLKIILEQMDNQIYKIYEREGKNEIGFFSNIKYENKNIPVLITNYHTINENYLNENNSIKIIINKEIKNIKLGNVFYFNKEIDLSILEIEENKNTKINFLELDENLFKNDIELIYKKESIYIFQSDKNKNILVSYGIIKYINGQDLTYCSNVNSSTKISPIFNLSNNKLIGIYVKNSNYYNKGIILKYIINEFINRYKNSMNEIDILINVGDNNINKKIYFLGEKFEVEKNNINELYINNNKNNFKRYFIPKEKGKYIIKIIFKKFIIDSSFMFAECENINSINFISFCTKDITNMEGMFLNCKQLKNVNLFSFEFKNEMKVKKMFYGCENLINLDLSSFENKNIEYLEAKMFSSSSFDEFEILPIDYINYDYNYKIILLGDSGVGKEKIIYQNIELIKTIRNDELYPTLGFDYVPFCFKYKAEIIKFEIWDTCGQESYRSLIKSFFTNSSLAIIIYAINDIDSFNSILKWVKQCRDLCDQDTKYFLVGNKIDIDEKE